jgi:Protein of unknown function (DUF2947)
LENDSWIISSQEIGLATWIDAYNEDDSIPVKQVFELRINWKLSDSILFFISRLLVIETTWEIFMKNWTSFLECDDDCPLIINRSIHRKEAIIFKPIGNISYIKQ